MQCSFPGIMYLQENNYSYDEFITGFVKEYMLNTDLTTVPIRQENEYDTFLKIITSMEKNDTLSSEDKQKNIGFSLLFVMNEFSKFEFNHTMIQNESFQLNNEYTINPYNEEIKSNIIYFIKVKIYTFNVQFKLLQKTINIINDNLKNIID